VKGNAEPLTENKPDASTPLGERIVEQLKTIYDPEIPVNLYDLGLIYKIDIKEKENGLSNVEIDMTLTSPTCPIADTMPVMVQRAVEGLAGISEVTVNLVWDPPWDQSHMSDEARIMLDMF
jgi:FeS assembly SUF system protein